MTPLPHLVLGLGQAGVEGVALHGAAAAHAGGDDELAGGVQVAEDGHVAKVLGRVLVGLLEAAVVVLDDGVEEVGEGGVGLSVRGVDADSRVVVLQSGLDHVQQGGAEGGGLLVLQGLEDLLGQVLLQQRLGVGGGQLGESSVQLLNNGGVNHGVGFASATRRKRGDN